MTEKRKSELHFNNPQYFILHVSHELDSGVIQMAVGNQNEFFAASNSNIKEDLVSVSFVSLLLSVWGCSSRT
jgi:hypothetical protein